MSESIPFAFDGATVTRAATTALTRRNLYVVRSFDLRAALEAHTDRERLRQSPWDCACPHHGTERCNCQFVVLLVYGEAAEPITLTLHCRDGQTQAQIVQDVTAIPDPRLAEQALLALLEAALFLHVTPSPTARVASDAH